MFWDAQEAHVLYVWGDLLGDDPPPGYPDQDPMVVEVEWDAVAVGDHCGSSALLHLLPRMNPRRGCGHVAEADA